MHDIAQRITWTIRLLMGGTPVILYGDELGLKQVGFLEQPSVVYVQNESFLENSPEDALGRRRSVRRLLVVLFGTMQRIPVILRPRKHPRNKRQGDICILNFMKIISLFSIARAKKR